MNARRILALASFDLLAFGRNRAAVLNFLGTAACLAFFCWIGSSPLIPPASRLAPEPHRMDVKVIDEVGLGIPAMLEEHGLRITPDADVTVTVGKDGGDAAKATITGLEAGDPRAYGIRGALGEAREASRQRLLEGAGIAEAYDGALPVQGLPPRPEAPADDGYVGAISDALDNLTLPDLSAPLALMVAVSAMVHALVEGYLIPKFSGRLEFLYATEVTPAEYVASRFLVAIVASTALTAIGLACLWGWMALDGEAPAARTWGLLVAGPLAACVVLPMGLVGATMFRRIELAGLGIYAGMAPILGATGLFGLLGSFGVDPSWQSHWPVHGVARWLQGREIDPAALATSSVATVLLLAAATWLAVRRTRATCYAQMDL